MTSSQQRWILGLAALATFMTALDTLVVSTALTSIQRDLDADVAQLEWTVNGYNLSFAVLILTMAALGDRLGRRRVFVAGILVFTVASAVSALAGSAEVLIAARVGQGVGAAAVTPLALTLVIAAFPPERRGATLGLLGGLTGLAVASGPLVGGAIVDGLDWSWIFWVNVPIGLLCAVLALVKVPESSVPGVRLDLRGAALQAAAAFGIVWGLSRGNTVGWSDPEVLVSFTVGAVALVAFVGVERRSSQPMLAMTLFRSRSFSAGNVASFFMIASLFGAVFLMAQFFQVSLGDDPFEAGLKLLPWTATPMLVAPLAGALSDRVGARPVLATGLGLQFAGLGWLALTADSSSSYGDLVVPLVVAGVGISMAIPSAQSAVIGAVPDGDVGTASGTVTTMRELGGVFGIAVGAAVFSTTGALTSATAFADGFTRALGVAAVLSAVGAAAALVLPTRTAVAPALPAEAVTV